MGQPYIGEIRIFAGNFAPNGWMFCEGQTIAISENDALFTLIGTTYGGDGEETFNLPDLRGRIPLHMGTGSGITYQLAESGGVEEVLLVPAQIPQHTHTLVGTKNQATTAVPSSSVVPALAFASTISPYGTDTPLSTLDVATLTNTGGSQPHTNVQPYLCVNFIISMFGIFPHQ